MGEIYALTRVVRVLRRPAVSITQSRSRLGAGRTRIARGSSSYPLRDGQAFPYRGAGSRGSGRTGERLLRASVVPSIHSAATPRHPSPYPALVHPQRR